MEESYQNYIETLNKISENLDRVDAIILRTFRKEPTFSEIFPWLFASEGETNERRKGRNILLENLADISSSFERYFDTYHEEPVATEILGDLYPNLFETNLYEKILWFFSYLIKVWRTINVDEDTMENIFEFLTRFPIYDTKVAMIFHMPSGADMKRGWALHEAKTVTTERVVKFLMRECSLLHRHNEAITYSEDDFQGLYDSCNLQDWIRQGVLLFNSKLTYRGEIWNYFTDAVVRQLNKSCSHLVFMLAGNAAREKFRKIDDVKHLVIELYHPTAGIEYQTDALKRWEDALPFTHSNFFLHQNNIELINWANTSYASMESYQSLFDDVADFDLVKLALQTLL